MKKLISVLLIVSILFSSAAAFSLQANAADDYPYKNGAIDALDAWYFYTRECTSFCAWRLNHNLGIDFNNYYGGVHWGNASNWGNAAKKIGIDVDMKPAVGAIAWWARGHVAWVSAVNGDTVTVEEYNWVPPYEYCVRTFAASAVSGYIHFRCAQHAWDAGVMTIQATCVRDGKKIYTCKKCGETKTEIIPKNEKGHQLKTIKTQKATVTANGLLYQQCTICGQAFQSVIDRQKGVKLLQTNMTYTGKALKPEVRIEDMKGRVFLPKYYTLTYHNNTNVGKAYAIVTLKGRYSGSYKRVFSVIPKGSAVAQVTGGKGTFTASWKKQTVQTTGYQVQCAADSKFTKIVKLATAYKNTKLNATISVPGANGTYYVRVRTFKTVSKNNHYFSTWSPAKTVNIYKAGAITKAELPLENGKTYKDYDVTGNGKADTVVCRYGQTANHLPTVTVLVNGKEAYYSVSGAKGIQMYLFAPASKQCYFVLRDLSVHGGNSDTFLRYAGTTLVPVNQDIAVQSHFLTAHKDYKRLDAQTFSAVLSSGYDNRDLVDAGSKPLAFLLKYKADKNGISLASKYGDAIKATTYHANKTLTAYDSALSKTKAYTIYKGDAVKITRVYLKICKAGDGYTYCKECYKATVSAANGKVFTCWIYDYGSDYNAPLFT